MGDIDRIGKGLLTLSFLGHRANPTAMITQLESISRFSHALQHDGHNLAVGGGREDIIGGDVLAKSKLFVDVLDLCEQIYVASDLTSEVEEL